MPIRYNGWQKLTDSMTSEIVSLKDFDTESIRKRSVIVNTQLVFSAVWYIGVTLAVCVVLIQKKYRVGLITLFMGLYIAGQILGYGFDIHLLKAVVPLTAHPNTGTDFQIIPSTVFPLLLAVVIYFGHKRAAETE